MTLLKRAEDMKPILMLPDSDDIKKQIKMLNITTNDLAVAQLLQPIIDQHIFEIVESFYLNLKNNDHLVEIVEKFGSFDRHKAALRKHISDMFTGIIDDHFFSRREVIANVHLNIGLTQEWYIVSFESIFKSITEIIQRTFNDKEDIYIATKVVNQLINLEIQVVLKAYNYEMNRLKVKEEEAKSQLMYMAFYDDITGLPKRSKIISDIESLIIENKSFALLNLDVKHVRFLGESSQDESRQLLFTVRDRLINALEGISHQIGRFNGTEFIIIIENFETKPYLIRIIEKILDKMKTPLHFNSRDIHLTTSIGVSSYPNTTQSPDTLLRYANLAMSEQKKTKHSGYYIYTQELMEKKRERINLEDYLRKAIEKEELELYYQPQIDSQNNSLVGLEALVRWNHPDKGIVSPGRFIPIAEETGIIYDITKWVILEVCNHLQEWRSKKYNEIPVWINISSFQFYDSDFVSNIKDSLKLLNIKPELIGLEITESAMMDPHTSEIQLKQLERLGIQISLDDFGTGYSSLSYLHRLPVHGLKIDRSFVSNVTENDNNKAIVESIITLAEQLDLNIIAEGVETKEQLKYLQKLNCFHIQGYYYSRPLPKHELERIYFIGRKEVNHSSSNHLN